MAMFVERVTFGDLTGILLRLFSVSFADEALAFVARFFVSTENRINDVFGRTVASNDANTCRCPRRQSRIPR